MSLACLGDSNTFGYDPQSLWGGRYAKDVRWTCRLEAAGFRVRNFGQNGLGVTPAAVHPALVWELLSVQPAADIAVVMLGTNDLLTGLSAARTAQAMESLLSLIIEKQAARQILLISPVPLRPGVWVEDPAVIAQSRALADEYRRLAAEKGVRFADAGEWDIPLAYDGVHFTEEGHRIFAEKLGALLTAAV